MKLNINLASRPYEDARRFYMQWLPLLVVLAAIAITLCVYAYHRFDNSRQIERQLAEKRQQVTQLDKERSEAESILNRPENSGTRDQAQFLNAIFARKAFSWTSVLADLEKIMPPRVQVVSIKPDLNADGQLQFLLSVTSERRDDAIDLVRRMEKSPRFSNPQMVSEKAKSDSKDNKLAVEIISEYIPAVRKGSS
ncbi:MAG: PilN domain-containing protein [Bryobacteraceae bacterium]